MSAICQPPPFEGDERALWFAQLDRAIALDVQAAAVRLTALGLDDDEIDAKLVTYGERLTARIRGVVDGALAERMWAR